MFQQSVVIITKTTFFTKDGFRKGMNSPLSIQHINISLQLQIDLTGDLDGTAIAASGERAMHDFGFGAIPQCE